MHGRRRFGPLPDSRVVSTVFARAAQFRTVGAADFGCPMLTSVAGLVDAHRRLAATRPDWDEVVMTWIPGRFEPELPGMDLAADPFTGAWRTRSGIFSSSTWRHTAFSVHRAAVRWNITRAWARFSAAWRICTRFRSTATSGTGRRRHTGGNWRARISPTKASRVSWPAGKSVCPRRPAGPPPALGIDNRPGARCGRTTGLRTATRVRQCFSY